MIVSVIVPSVGHVDPDGRPFVDGAVASVRAQRDLAGVKLEIIVATGLGQAAALNRAAERASGDAIAFLEDDDRWVPGKLAVQVPLLAEFDLVTCTQAEVDLVGNRLPDNTFPTPSGWVMRRSAWERVGGFDERVHFHIDNDFLGRAVRARLSRAHVVPDGTHPRIPPTMPTAVVESGPRPLVIRTVRPQSRCSQILHDPEARRLSLLDRQLLRTRYGSIPT